MTGFTKLQGSASGILLVLAFCGGLVETLDGEAACVEGLCTGYCEDGLAAFVSTGGSPSLKLPKSAGNSAVNSVDVAGDTEL